MIPTINKTSEEYGKFIQIKYNKKPYFRFLSRNYTHARGLNNFLKENTIEFAKLKGTYEDLIPSPKGDNYELVGAGTFTEIEGYKLNGESSEYEIGPNKEHAEEISKLTGLEFTIRG